VAELSEPTCPSVQETIDSVVHGLLATLSPKLHSKAPPVSENAPGGTLNVGKDDCTELMENTSLQFQPMISLSRDYLARLLFWYDLYRICEVHDLSTMFKIMSIASDCK